MRNNLIALLLCFATANVLQMRPTQFNDMVASKEHILVNFYSTECGFWYFILRHKASS